MWQYPHLTLLGNAGHVMDFCWWGEQLVHHWWDLNMSVQLFEFIISNSVNFLHQFFFHYEWLSRWSSTLSLPRVTKKYFLLATSIQHQTDKKQEYEMISIRGLSFVSTLNYQNQTYKYFLADSKYNYLRDLVSEWVKSMGGWIKKTRRWNVYHKHDKSNLS